MALKLNGSDDLATRALAVWQVAKTLNCSEPTVYRLIESGALYAVRTGGPRSRYFVPVEAVDAFLAGRAYVPA